MGRVVAVGFWVAFCNPRMFKLCGVCGGCVGYIFVTRECLSFVVFVEDVWVTFL